MSVPTTDKLPWRWGFGTSFTRGVIEADVVRAALRSAGVNVTGLEIDAAKQSVLVHVDGITDWWAVYRDLTVELAPQLWTVILEQPAPVTETAPPPAPPWWYALRAGDRARPARDGVPVLLASGAPWRRVNQAGPDGAPVVWTVWAPGVDLAGGRVCVYSGDEARYPGGLWVAGADLAPA